MYLNIYLLHLCEQMHVYSVQLLDYWISVFYPMQARLVSLRSWRDSALSSSRVITVLLPISFSKAMQSANLHAQNMKRHIWIRKKVTQRQNPSANTDARLLGVFFLGIFHCHGLWQWLTLVYTPPSFQINQVCN